MVNEIKEKASITESTRKSIHTILGTVAQVFIIYKL